jgi:leucyl/phenylalanyl-tRNA--protein transferase
MILFPDELKVSKSMRQVVRSKRFSITFNQSFEKVISNCKTIDRSLQDQKGTWITEEMQKAYISLHQEGCAKSIEVWENDNLVGGLYGIEVGSVFCGESMFSKVSNASKMALIALSENNNNPYALIDCQVYNDHLSSLGAREISRERFLAYLR